jgi:hypothetical protein
MVCALDEPCIGRLEYTSTVLPEAPEVDEPALELVPALVEELLEQPAAASAATIATAAAGASFLTFKSISSR